jgi:CRISPR/Cas system-associated protein Cas10 (large subunit of type III CRISPR-Cas system)
MSQHDGEIKSKKQLTHQERNFIETQNHCALCNTPLEIKVESYLEDYFLREEAECPSCKIKTRVKNHKIQ